MRLTYCGIPLGPGRFQSPPDPEAGCDEAWMQRVDAAVVSIPTRPGGRVRLYEPPDLPLPFRLFQSPPDPEAGCDHATGEQGVDSLRVSIPTRPGGRVRPGPAYERSQRHGFNPHPTRRPGATLTPADLLARGLVSIPTRPGGRVRPVLGPPLPLQTLFQSPPDPEAGCDGWVDTASTVAYVFQSPPDPEAGCDATMAPTHSEPVPAFQSPPDPEAGCDTPMTMVPPGPTCFNPHPTRRPGATTASCSPAGARRRTNVFQSPPDPEAGCDWLASLVLVPRAMRFNPHPTRRPGATFCRRNGGRGKMAVSIPTRPGGRVRRAGGRVYHKMHSEFQSPPDPEAGCDGRVGSGRAVVFGFQSPPDPEAGCDPCQFACRYAWPWFQSPPDPEAGCCQSPPALFHP